VLTNLDYSGDEETIHKKFFQNGIETVDRVYRLLKTNQYFDTAIDFGSGVGRLLIPMSKYVKNLIGIENSPTMIQELKKNIERYKLGDSISLSEEVQDIVLKVDWINSLLVFQHIPPERGYDLLEQLLLHLKIGGFFSLQFTIFNNQFQMKGFHQQTDSTTIKQLYLKHNHQVGSMAMYDYDINRIYFLFQKFGIEDFRCVSCVQGGKHHTVLFVGQRGKETCL
jgi:cyclopropane fatty-acyl-phospholipid synthase-like methyltransferase